DGTAHETPIEYVSQQEQERDVRRLGVDHIVVLGGEGPTERPKEPPDRPVPLHQTQVRWNISLRREEGAERDVLVLRHRLGKLLERRVRLHDLEQESKDAKPTSSRIRRSRCRTLNAHPVPSRCQDRAQIALIASVCTSCSGLVASISTTPKSDSSNERTLTSSMRRRR